MTVYIIRYANYLEGFEIMDFEDEAEARKRIDEPDPPHYTLLLIDGPSAFRTMSSSMRRDIFSLMQPDDVADDVNITREQLWDKIERWVKEP